MERLRGFNVPPQQLPLFSKVGFRAQMETPAKFPSSRVISAEDYPVSRLFEISYEQATRADARVLLEYRRTINLFSLRHSFVEVLNLTFPRVSIDAWYRKFSIMSGLAKVQVNRKTLSDASENFGNRVRRHTALESVL